MRDILCPGSFAARLEIHSQATNIDPLDTDDDHGPLDVAAWMRFYHQQGLDQGETDWEAVGRAWGQLLLRANYAAYAEPQRLPLKTKTIPGTEAKIEILHKRAMHKPRVALYHPKDADMDGAELEQREVVNPGNHKREGLIILLQKVAQKARYSEAA